jgi:hypothetical protein
LHCDASFGRFPQETPLTQTIETKHSTIEAIP